MRIIIDMQGAQTESRYRGIGRYTLSFAQAVVRNRGEHEVILALSGLFPDTIEPIRAAFDGLLSQENIRIWHAPGRVREEQPGNEPRRKVAELIRESFISSLRPDVIHISSLFEGYVDDAVTSIGRFDKHTPVSVSLYDLIPLLNPDQYLKPNPRYEQYYQRKVGYLKQAASFLAISEFTRQEGLAHLGVPEVRVVNVSTAIEPRYRPLSIGDSIASQVRKKFDITHPFVLYTGGADERKNLPCLIQAYAALPPVLRQEHQLLFAGKISDGNIARFRLQAKAAGLKADELSFTGYVSDEELVQLYNLCKLFVFPSWHEGFGLPALEAMACGVPVISANTSSLPEVIGFNEAMFNPLDISAMATKMQQALEDEAFRERLCAHGLQRTKLFSWDETARRAITAWESVQADHEQPQAEVLSNRKPRLAFVSPLPPERTGIADYSTELLPALAEHYEIEVVVSQERVDDPWVNRHCKERDVAWLRAHAGELDRVLYQVGNSQFHRHMLALLREIPGSVVMHDFYMSGLMSWLELHAGSKHAWTRAIYEAHGYDAVRMLYSDAEVAKRKYPANFGILQYAQGIIVHSDYSRQLAMQWYGNDISGDWVVIPHLRSPVASFDREEARKQLDFGINDFVICSFGFLDPSKLNHRLLECWLNSSLSKDKRCHLIFVGENHGGEYGVNLLQMIKGSGLGKRIRITGFASPEVFRQYLMATDVAVQLRTLSRGETSGTVLDCMNHALPLIVNANGSMAELDHEAVWMMPDEFADDELIQALEALLREPERRSALGERARAVIHDHHTPAECARRYMEAIEDFHRRSETATQSLVSAVAGRGGAAAFSDTELLHLSKSIATSLPLVRPAKRLYLEISATCRNDLKSGIERVARALLLALLEAPPSGYRIEPVYLDNVEGNWLHRHARSYTLGLLGCPAEILDDEIVEPEYGDILLGLDLSGGMLVQAQQAGLYAEYRIKGAAIYSVVFDLLPIRIPEVFPPGADQTHRQWLEAISSFDGAVCISKAVADDLAQWQCDSELDWEGRRPYQIGWFHLGADIINSAPSHGLPDNTQTVLAELKARPSFLMVGTIEPRKGYQQTLEAFTQLWKKNIDINLVIVGKEGWLELPDDMRRNIPETIQLLRAHPELNKRLFWLEGISDEYLEKVYAASTCLLAASYGEGFGLPLIEAARHKLPIIARDIPVFREVAGEYAYYFCADSPQDFANHIGDWLAKWESGQLSISEGITCTTWRQSAKALIDFFLGVVPRYRQVSPQIKKKAIDEHLDLIHRARMQMVSTLLPPGDVILDLGGANCPLYKMGYSHHFKKLHLIDLPPDERHEMYKEIVVDPNCEGGEVVIYYGDMTNLNDFSDESVDFVWSGQSIEHIPYEKGMAMCKAAYRVLKKGGAFCLDTPNRLLTEIHTSDIGGGFIHPEHCVEYYPNELKKMLENAGFIIKQALGICEMPSTRNTGHFNYEDFMFGKQITTQVEDGYIQFFHCQKP